MDENTKRKSGKGFVYVARSDAHPGLLKIGFTRQSPHKRIQQFSTGSPQPFDLIHCVEVADPQGLERQLHQKLSGCRVNEGREFFEASLTTVQYWIRILCEEVRYREDLQAAQEQLDRAAKWRFKDAAWLRQPIWSTIKEKLGKLFEPTWVKWLAFLIVAQPMGLWNYAMFSGNDWTDIDGYLSGARMLYYPLIPVSWFVAFISLILACMAIGFPIALLVEYLDTKTNMPELEVLRERLAREMRLKVADLKI